MIFIRRSFRDDAVYKHALRSTSPTCCASASTSSGTSRAAGRGPEAAPPRFGLLAYLVDAFQRAGDRGVFLVPVSIVYDQLPEVGTMAAEDRGGAKRPESFALAGRLRAVAEPSGGRAP